MVRWSRPKDKTVARIPETGLQLRVLESQEDGIDIQPRELGGQEFVFLLRISGRTMRRIQRLDLRLDRVLSVSEHTRARRMPTFRFQPPADLRSPFLFSSPSFEGKQIAPSPSFAHAPLSASGRPSASHALSLRPLKGRAAYRRTTASVDEGVVRVFPRLDLDSGKVLEVISSIRQRQRRRRRHADLDRLPA